MERSCPDVLDKLALEWPLSQCWHSDTYQGLLGQLQKDTGYSNLLSLSFFLPRNLENTALKCISWPKALYYISQIWYMSVLCREDVYLSWKPWESLHYYLRPVIEGDRGVCNRLGITPFYVLATDLTVMRITRMSFCQDLLHLSLIKLRQECLAHILWLTSYVANDISFIS